MGETLLEKVSGIYLKGEPIVRDSFENYQSRISYASDCCYGADCGDCDCGGYCIDPDD